MSLIESRLGPVSKSGRVMEGMVGCSSDPIRRETLPQSHR